MKQDTETTRVIFRCFSDGEVIALFPSLPGDADPETCMSYMHIGQHGAASMGLGQTLRLATPEEYAPLAAELESIGYRLDIRRRATRRDREERTRN